MTSKFELSISTSYVPDWTVTEAFRELFQNALDNEIVNHENKMGWQYKIDAKTSATEGCEESETGTVSISNKTSKLLVESLLLGNGTKHDSNNTIGKHGEGYKIAFMVLLRNNKTITVDNYGANEKWEVRLVKSRKYKGQLVPTVFIEKSPVWKKKPNNDLTIRVSGVTQDEYKELVNKNLHLRKSVERYDVPNLGGILLDEKEVGNIYVKGLYVNNIEGLEYGYDFEPSIIKLDRDRKLVDSFNVKWEASNMWIRASKNDKNMLDKAVNMVNRNVPDVSYVSNLGYGAQALYTAVGESFYNENGDDAVPVVNTVEYEYVKNNNLGKPIIVSESKASILNSDYNRVEKRTILVISVKDKLTEFANKIADKLTYEENLELTALINEVAN